MKKNLSTREIKEFQSLIWNFYKKNGRDMPWRGESDPYCILVSEIMLQQTQVSRVIDKYTEFLRRFPNIKKLAKAPLSDVLITWQGLGYNRRARFLHKCAKCIVERYNGVLPSNYQDLLALPGIGKGTVGSISAFAFNLPVVFIETNIRRVYIYYFFPDKNDVADEDLLPLINQTLDKKRPREWYYALMDYGAFLRGQVDNPNKKSKHYIKQSKFKGSNREVRGAIVRYLSFHKRVNTDSVQINLGFDKKRFDVALQGLEKEGMILRKNNKIELSHHVI